MSQFCYYKLILLFLIIAVNSCAFSNSRYVSVFIHTYPNDAQIYIDGKKYGTNTSTAIDLEPNRDYKVLLRKDGYDDVEFVLKPQSFLRNKFYAKGEQSTRGVQSTRCLFDTLTLIPLLFRVYPAYALRCDDFEKSKYKISLVKNNYPKKRYITGFKYRYESGFTHQQLGLFPYPLTVPPSNYNTYRNGRSVDEETP